MTDHTDWKHPTVFASTLQSPCPVCRAVEGGACRDWKRNEVKLYHAKRVLWALARDRAMKATPWRLHDDSTSDGHNPAQRWWVGRVNATGPYCLPFQCEVDAIDALTRLNDAEPYVAAAERAGERTRLLQRTDPDGRSNWVGYWEAFESLVTALSNSTDPLRAKDRLWRLRAHVEDRLAALAARFHEERTRASTAVDSAITDRRAMEAVLATFGELLGLNPTEDHPHVAVRRVRALRDIAVVAAQVVKRDHATGLNGSDVRITLPVALWDQLAEAVLAAHVPTWLAANERVFNGSRPVGCGITEALGRPPVPAHECLDLPVETPGQALFAVAEEARGSKDGEHHAGWTHHYLDKHGDLREVSVQVLWCDPGAPRSAVPCGLDVSHATRWPKEG